MWYDGDPKRPLAVKVRNASLRHRAKYGQWPDTCRVHPGSLPEGKVVTVKANRPGTNGDKLPAVKVRVLADPTTLAGHLWIGREETEGVEREA